MSKNVLFFCSQYFTLKYIFKKSEGWLPTYWQTIWWFFSKTYFRIKMFLTIWPRNFKTCITWYVLKQPSDKGFLPAKLGHYNMTNFLGFRLTSWISWVRIIYLTGTSTGEYFFIPCLLVNPLTSKSGDLKFFTFFPTSTLKKLPFSWNKLLFFLYFYSTSTPL
jgi:hypothetical protein